MPLNMIRKSSIHSAFKFIKSPLAIWSLGHIIHDALAASFCVLGSWTSIAVALDVLALVALVRVAVLARQIRG